MHVQQAGFDAGEAGSLGVEAEGGQVAAVDRLVAHEVHQQHNQHGDPHIAGQAQKGFQEFHILQPFGQGVVDEIKGAAGAEGLQVLGQLVELFALADDLGQAIDDVAGAGGGDEGGHLQILHDAAVHDADDGAGEDSGNDADPCGHAHVHSQHAQHHGAQAHGVGQGEIDAAGGEHQHHAHAGHAGHGGLLDYGEDCGDREEIRHHEACDEEQDGVFQDDAVVLRELDESAVGFHVRALLNSFPLPQPP